MAEGTPVITADSRAWRYGDGLFETIKYGNNTLQYADEHFSRLWKGLQLLQFEIPKLFTPEKLGDEILKTVQKNKLTHARVRLAVFRGEGGLYDAKSHQPNFIIQTWPIQANTGSFNENGLTLCIYQDALKTCDTFSNIKHNNYLPYMMGALFAKSMQCNDAIILNTHRRICDSTIANIFMIKDKIIYTPPLQEGCVAGIMRKTLIQKLKEIGIEVNELPLTIEMILNAEEVFLTNSIINIQWVSGIQNKTYSGQQTREIIGLLQQKNLL